MRNPSRRTTSLVLCRTPLYSCLFSEENKEITMVKYDQKKKSFQEGTGCLGLFKVLLKNSDLDSLIQANNTPSPFYLNFSHLFEGSSEDKYDKQSCWHQSTNGNVRSKYFSDPCDFLLLLLFVSLNFTRRGNGRLSELRQFKSRR